VWGPSRFPLCNVPRPSYVREPDRIRDVDLNDQLLLQSIVPIYPSPYLPLSYRFLDLFFFSIISLFIRWVLLF